VRTALEKEMPADEFTEFVEHVKGITRGLLGELERRLADETVALRPRRKVTRTSFALKRLGWMPETIVQDIGIHLFYRWKLRKPLTRVVVPPVSKSWGHRLLF
jgi:hypothetical protein